MSPSSHSPSDASARIASVQSTVPKLDAEAFGPASERARVQELGQLVRDVLGPVDLLEDNFTVLDRVLQPELLHGNMPHLPKTSPR